MKPDVPSSQRLGLLSLACLVVANMIGAGVYTSSGFALGSLHTRQWVLAAWAIGGVISILGAVCYGGLVKQITESGGEALFLSRLVHPIAGFMAGWISLTAGFSGAIAFAALTFESYLPTHELYYGWPRGAIACLLIVVFGMVHWSGFSTGARFQNSLVLIKLALMVGFVLYGASVVGSGTYFNGQVRLSSVEPAAVLDIAGQEPQAATGLLFLSALATSVMWISLSYAGYNAAVYVAGASTNGPTVARSMWIATAAVTVLYLSLNYVVLYAVPISELVNQKEVLKIAAAGLGIRWVEFMVVGVILLSLATSVSAMLQVGPHVYAQMSRDRLLPRGLSVMSGAHGAIPRRGILLQVVLACVLVLLADLQQLLDYLTFMLLLSSAATVGCLLMPAIRGIPGRRPVAFWPWTPLAFVAISLGIAFLSLKFRWETDPRGLIKAMVVLPLGLVIYPLCRQRGD